jgi:hypothetical protein
MTASSAGMTMVGGLAPRPYYSVITGLRGKASAGMTKGRP